MTNLGVSSNEVTERQDGTPTEAEIEVSSVPLTPGEGGGSEGRGGTGYQQL